MIPPDHDGEYVARMEDVLGVYRRTHDASAPVVCMDEMPVQLTKETRQPIPAGPGHPRRIDYEYERNGTANIFMFVEPLLVSRAMFVRHPPEPRSPSVLQRSARMRPSPSVLQRSARMRPWAHGTLRNRCIQRSKHVAAK